MRRNGSGRLRRDGTGARSDRLVCVIGSLVGRNPGHVTTQGEILTELLERSGHRVIAASSAPGRVRRFGEIVTLLWTHRRSIDVLLLQVYSGRSFIIDDIASLLGRMFDQHIVMHVHGGGIPDFVTRYPRWTRRVLERADLVVAPTRFLGNALSPTCRSVRVIPNVIEIESYPYRPRRAVRPRLLWMRSFHDVYNPRLAVEVLARVRQRIPDATLVMAGQDKGLEGAVREAVRLRGLDAAVRFPGFLGFDAKRREGMAADIFLNTNRVDNTPVAVIEACAMGLPVVTTDVGGLPYLLTHRETGMLAPNGSVGALADAVVELVQTAALAERLSVGGRALAEQCSWSRVEGIWNDVLRGWAGQDVHAHRAECRATADRSRARDEDSAAR